MDDEKALVRKWGKDGLCMGWAGVPAALLFMQSELGLGSLELNILLNLMIHWWDRDDKIYPSQDSIAARIGVSKRTVQRGLEKLIDLKLIVVMHTARDGQYKGRNIYDLSPLVRKVEKNAPYVKLYFDNKRKIKSEQL